MNSKTILVVHPDYEIVRRIEKALEEAGHRVFGITPISSRSGTNAHITSELLTPSEIVEVFQREEIELDLLFIEHGLGMVASWGGEEVARFLGMPPEKCIGLIGPFRPGSYTGRDVQPWNTPAMVNICAE